MNAATLPAAHRAVLDVCESEAWTNAESGDPDAQTAADVAADIVQRLYTEHRVIAHDDGEPGPLSAAGHVKQAPTYHGIQFAQCFTCGHATADTEALEAWNDLLLGCPECGAEARVLWVLTGGRVFVSSPGGGLSTLRLGSADGTPPDAPGTLTGPELDGAEVAPTWPQTDLNPCLNARAHRPGQRHPETDCPVWLDMRQRALVRGFAEQNPDAMTGIDSDVVRTYAEHHSGGLIVMGRALGDGRYVKMHDSWGDPDDEPEGHVVVHVYDTDPDPLMSEDPTETITYFPTGAAALPAFLAEK